MDAPHGVQRLTRVEKGEARRGGCTGGWHDDKTGSKSYATWQR